MHVHYTETNKGLNYRTLVCLFICLFYISCYYSSCILLCPLIIVSSNLQLTTHHFLTMGLSPRPLQSYICTLHEFSIFLVYHLLFPSKQFFAYTFSACSSLTTLVNLSTPSHCSSSYTLLTCRLPTVTHNVVMEGIQLFVLLPSHEPNISFQTSAQQFSCALYNPPHSAHLSFHLSYFSDLSFIFMSLYISLHMPLIKPYSQDTPCTFHCHLLSPQPCSYFSSH